jgi:nitrate reductase gamma subunit
MSNSLFTVWPYGAFAVFIAGVGVSCVLAPSRMVRQRARLHELQTLLPQWWAWGPSLLALSLLHLLGLLFPHSVILWDLAPVRLYVLEGMSLCAGLLALWSGVRVVLGYLRSPARSMAWECMDGIFWSLLFVAMVSGVLMAILYRWASSWGGTTLTPYVLSVLAGKPAATLVVAMPFLVRLHVFSAFAALAIFPFSRICSLLMVVLAAVLDRVMRPLRTWAEAQGAAIVLWWRAHDPILWILQDEED